jgi:hypothetical protein
LEQTSSNHDTYSGSEEVYFICQEKAVVDPTISKTEHVFGLPAGGIAYSDERYDKV